MKSLKLHAPQTPPSYCQYAGSNCNETFLPAPTKPRVFFAYPSRPPQIAESISLAVDALREAQPDWDWQTWTDINVSGQLIFCEICKRIRSSHALVADTTTLNFNLLFEIGFAVSLGVPLVLIRDSTYAVDSENFRRLGLLDTVGHIDFQNSADLAAELPAALSNAKPIPDVPQRAFRETPVYVLRSTIPTDGSLSIEATLKKSRLRYRTYDPGERFRLTLNDARRQVNGSLAVVANLLDENREGARVHNALVAFVAGYAVGRERIVALLQEGLDTVQPIDYRDIVLPYELAVQISTAMRPTLHRVYDVLQSRRFDSPEAIDLGILRELDLGDVAAENEIGGLQQYFVPTGQSIAARRGHSPLVVGRKGSGKSAIFYEIRNSEGRGVHELVLDLRPEGNQFARLREYVEDQMSLGMQEFALTGFWTYLLLTEIARKLLEQDATLARRDPDRLIRFKKLADVYANHNPGELVDFPQRLVYYVSRLVSPTAEHGTATVSVETIMQSLYAGESKPLRESVIEYLQHKESVWLLIDNLDKSWPIGGSSSTDLLLIRSLLEAVRKLRNQLQDRDTEFKSLVFLRSDIYDHLIEETPDKGKETAIRLEWNDPTAFERIIERRVVASTDLQGDFRDEIWPAICAPLVHTDDSFGFILDRTLMRPRDLLMFLHRCVETAINRGHSRIEEGDILFAENGYSNDMLRNLQYEIEDLNPAYRDVLESFALSQPEFDLEDARLQLGVYADIEDPEEADKALHTLIRYGFLGVKGGVFRKPTYAFTFTGGFERLRYPLDNDDGTLVIHPAFRSALEVPN